LSSYVVGPEIFKLNRALQLGVHLDKVQFKAAIEFTAAETGFQPELMEKDYICSLILNDFASRLQDILIFKGGTLLAYYLIT
jgi:hypothetical protein